MTCHLSALRYEQSNKKENNFQFEGGSNIYKLNFHRHVDGEEYSHGVGLPQDYGILQRKAWAGVPGE